MLGQGGSRQDRQDETEGGGVSRRRFIGQSLAAGAAGIMVHFLPASLGGTESTAEASHCTESGCSTSYEVYCGLTQHDPGDPGCGCQPCVGGVRVRVRYVLNCGGVFGGGGTCCCPPCNVSPICSPCDGRFLHVANYCTGH